VITVKKLAFVPLFILFSLCLVAPAFAAEEVPKQILPTSPLYLLVKVKESLQQFLTFNQNSKVQLLGDFTEQRVREMEYASSLDNGEALDASLNRYQAQKTMALGYVQGISDEKIVEEVKENTVEQQQTMTKMQLEIEGSPGVQQRIVEVQKEIAGKIKNTVEVIQGSEEATAIENKLHYVWLDPNANASGKLPPLPDEIGKWEYAPGTEGRDEAGRVVEYTVAGTETVETGGEKMQVIWAPGTEGGGESQVQYESGPKVVVQSAPTESGGENVTIETPKLEIKE
jgi:hypothetical protein